MFATLLYAGRGAALSHATALWLYGVLDLRPPLIHLSIPAHRQVVPAVGLRIHRARNLLLKTHPAASPTRTRLEHSVLDHIEIAETEVVIDVITRSVQRRLTTATRVRVALEHRSRHPHRLLIAEVLTDVEQGAQSPLERRYLRDVERAHGLPRGIRNAAESSALRTRYRDVRYLRWSTVVELDGRVALPTRLPSGTCAGTTMWWRPATPCSGTAGVTLPAGHAWSQRRSARFSGAAAGRAWCNSAGPSAWRMTQHDRVRKARPAHRFLTRSRVITLPLNPVRVVAEFTTEPFHGEGEPPDHAKRAWDVVQAAGLTGDFGPLGTEVQGDRDEVLDALREVMTVALDAGATRITLQLHLEP